MGEQIDVESLEIRENELKWQTYLSERALNMFSSHPTPISTIENPPLYTLSSEEVVQQTWELVGSLAADFPQYIAISGRFFLSESTKVLSLHIEECKAEGVLTYWKPEGLQGCIELPSRSPVCSPWMQVPEKKWTQVI